MGWARVHVGADSRVSAEKLWAQLRAAGASCTGAAQLKLIVAIPRSRCERPISCRAAEQRDEIAAFQLIELHSVPCQPGPPCRISNCKRSVSGHAGILQPVWLLPTLAGYRPLHLRHDRPADGAVFAAAPEAYVAMVVLTRLHLLTPQPSGGRDQKPT